MYLVFIAIGMVLILTISSSFQQKRYVKQLKLDLKENFGQKPNKKKTDLEKISLYWKTLSTHVPEDEKVDDVTWVDLQMDKIFKRLNSCSSFVGEQVLYAQIHKLPKSTQAVVTFSKWIHFFDKNEETRSWTQVQLTFLNGQMKNNDLSVFAKDIKKAFLKNIILFISLFSLLVVSALLLIIWRSPLFILSTVIILSINSLLYQHYKWTFQVNIEKITACLAVISVGKTLAQNQALQNFALENAFDLEKQVESLMGISKNSGLLGRVNHVAFVSNPLLGMLDFLIGCTLIDFIYYNRLLKNLENKQEAFFQLYDFMGQLDSAISIASYRRSLTHYCEPEFVDHSCIQVEEIYHPLVDDAVCNSQKMHRSFIVSGSNASGKSTYIKSLAINAILAQNIYTCSAKSMSLAPTHVITSMAVQDDLLAGESYFMKEIKYLNRIVQALDNERRVLCVVDEILRGTNTEERIAASLAILEFVSEHKGLAIVASHDHELTTLLKDQFDNYHFREIMLDSDVSFEYKLHHGPATTRNAIKLLEHIGFPNLIVTKAKQYLLK